MQMPQRSALTPQNPGRWHVKRINGGEETFDFIAINGTLQDEKGTYASAHIYAGDIWTKLEDAPAAEVIVEDGGPTNEDMGLPAPDAATMNEANQDSTTNAHPTEPVEATKPARRKRA
jgi:hypothetical protein